MVATRLGAGGHNICVIYRNDLLDGMTKYPNLFADEAKTKRKIKYREDLIILQECLDHV